MSIVIDYQQARKFFDRFGLKDELDKYLETSIKPIAIQEYNSSYKKLREFYKNFSPEGTNVSKETLGYNIATYTFDVFFKYFKMYFYITKKNTLEHILSISEKKEYKEVVIEWFKNMSENQREKYLTKYRKLINTYLMLMCVTIIGNNISIIDMNTILEEITTEQF